MCNIIIFLFIVCDHAGEHPIIVDFTRFDHDPGNHNITVVANSTDGKLDEWTYVFEVPGNTYDIVV